MEAMAWLIFRGYFYPRPPRGGRHKTGELALWDEEISIHALREEGDAHVVGGLAFCDEISIHALREEGDRRPGEIPRYPGISIHALREEGDRRARAARAVAPLFLSTPSARRATLHSGCTGCPG